MIQDVARIVLAQSDQSPNSGAFILLQNQNRLTVTGKDFILLLVYIKRDRLNLIKHCSQLGRIYSSKR